MRESLHKKYVACILGLKSIRSRIELDVNSSAVYQPPVTTYVFDKLIKCKTLHFLTLYKVLIIIEDCRI